jgi:hypothetical protein
VRESGLAGAGFEPDKDLREIADPFFAVRVVCARALEMKVSRIKTDQDERNSLNLPEWVIAA